MPPSAQEGEANGDVARNGKENWAGKGKAKRKERRATGERGVQRLLREIDPE